MPASTCRTFGPQLPLRHLPAGDGAHVTVEEYNRFCSALPATSHVVQWGGAHVWKVGGKVFAIAWHDDDNRADGLAVTFKVSELSFELLQAMPGCRPAPYLASRGLKWIQRTKSQSMDDAALRDYIIESLRIVASGLPKRVQKELGLTTQSQNAAPQQSFAADTKQSSRRAPQSRTKSEKRQSPRSPA